MIYRIIKKLPALILIAPLFAWGGDEIQSIKEKYELPDHKEKTLISPKMTAINTHQENGGDASSKTVYTYELDSDFETAKADLQRKGVRFSVSEEVPAKIPNKTPDYRASLGEDEEKNQVILASHQYDGPQKKWIRKTTVRFIVSTPPPPPTQPLPAAKKPFPVKR